MSTLHFLKASPTKSFTLASSSLFGTFCPSALFISSFAVSKQFMSRSTATSGAISSSFCFGVKNHFSLMFNLYSLKAKFLCRIDIFTIKAFLDFKGYFSACVILW
jgi:hypothetical protein